MTAPTFYLSDLNTGTYDLGIGLGGPLGDGDTKFYLGLARSLGDRVLELGCGTGRVAIPLAEAGLQVTGLDLSRGMLAEARRKAELLQSDASGRLTLVEGDMANFDLAAEFDLVVIPARAFAFLLAPEAQRSCLARVRACLRPGGGLAIDVFDPRLEWCVPGERPGQTDESGLLPNGNTLRVRAVVRHNDAVAQVLRETWRFTETEPNGGLVREVDEVLALRWTYRYEMRHLLELAGFEAISEASGYGGEPPAYGLEQVWTCRRPPTPAPLESGRS
jgi:SAM-dependent methyltransferase